MNQEQFDAQYIGTTEIAQIADVTRIAVYHVSNREDWPTPIFVGKTKIWERNVVMPHVNAWIESMSKGRGATTC